MRKVPDTIWLFRITHIQNLSFILEHGIGTANSQFTDPDFKPIGNSTLIQHRKNEQAPDPPGGVFEDYIPY